jgi:RHS repeat-associated protein
LRRNAVGTSPENRRISSTDRRAAKPPTSSDPAGRLRKTFLPNDGTPVVLEQVYDDAGRLHQSIDARGHATTFAYDDSGRRTTITDALNQVTLTAYDAAGNQVALTDPRGNTTAFVYDAANRLTRTVAPDATFRTTGYDALGRRISETDESGKVTQFGYDALGRLVSVTDALNQFTTYAYDEAGNRISQTDANGHVTRFEFDSVGRQTKRILPDGASERFTYDAVGNRSSRTPDVLGRTTLYDYDLQSRLLRRTYPGNVQVSFTYTPTGRRLTATDDRGVTTYGYDTRDRVTSLTYPDGRSLEYAYDEVGNRTALTANVAGRTLTTSYTYDDLNRLDTVTDPIGGVYDHNYDANGNRESLLFPNGVATTYAYNAKNQLLNISTVNNAGTTLVSFAYTLAPTGNRTKIVEHDGVTRNYAYDNLYRLTDEHVKQGTAPDAPTAWRNQFAYDPVGNRLEQLRQTENGTPQPVVYTYDDRDRLLTENGIAGPVTYGWDANGNQTAKSGVDGATYTWDIENRLVRVEVVDGTVLEHTYDADGARIGVRTSLPTGSSTAINQLVDTQGALSHVVAETDQTIGLTAYLVRGADLFATLRPTGGELSNLLAGYFHTEGLGSTRALTDVLGNVSDRYDLEAFGSLLDHQGDDPNPYLFAGEAIDRSLGWYFNRARWVQPALGTFSSTDPFMGRLEDPSSLHRFTYARANPSDLTDPTGEDIAGLMVATAMIGIVSVVAVRSISARLGPIQVRLRPVITNGSSWDPAEVEAELAQARGLFARQGTGITLTWTSVERDTSLSPRYSNPRGSDLPTLAGYYHSARAVPLVFVDGYDAPPDPFGRVSAGLSWFGGSASGCSGARISTVALAATQFWNVTAHELGHSIGCLPNRSTADESFWLMRELMPIGSILSTEEVERLRSGARRLR